LEDDRFDIVGLTTFSPDKPLTLVIHHINGVEERITVHHTYNKNQIDWFKAGSALNAMGKNKNSSPAKPVAKKAVKKAKPVPKKAVAKKAVKKIVKKVAKKAAKKATKKVVAKTAKKAVKKNQKTVKKSAKKSSKKSK
jgi:aconitate hydratase